MKSPCWSCVGDGCDACEYTGVVEWSRIDAWCRRRRYLGLRHPKADRNGNEKWARLSIEVPPEFLPLLEQAHRAATGGRVHFARRHLRAAIVRAAVYTYLEAHLPPEPEEAIEGEAIDLVARAAIGSGDDEREVA